MSTLVPVVDLSSPDAPAAIDAACRESGFFQVVNHGLDLTLAEDLLAALETFFHLPAEVKLQYPPPSPDVNNGYSAIGAESLAYSLGVEAPPDLFEAFNFGPEDPDLTNPAVAAERDRIFAPNIWPAEVPELRDRVVLSTKGGVFPPLPFDTSADHLRQACDASLYRLGVDVIDLYQVHQPDLLAHPGEVAEVLTELREAGKVREVGVCNHTAWQTQALQSFLDFPLVSVQVPLNAVRLGSLTDGTLDLAMELGLTPIASSPLASGSLVGEATSKKLQAVAAVFDRIAAEQGAPRVAVVLSWLLHHPAGVVPIVSTSRVARIRQCAEATEVGFSRQQWYEVLAASRGQSLF